jgi:hypothetical protein
VLICQLGASFQTLNATPSTDGWINVTNQDCDANSQRDSGQHCQSIVFHETNNSTGGKQIPNKKGPSKILSPFYGGSGGI